jgi:hypothetical protein
MTALRVALRIVLRMALEMVEVLLLVLRSCIISGLEIAEWAVLSIWILRMGGLLLSKKNNSLGAIEVY